MPSTLKINLKPLIAIFVGISAIVGLMWGFDDRFEKAKDADVKWEQQNTQNFKQMLRIKISDLKNRQYRIRERMKDNPELRTYFDDLTAEIRRVKAQIEKLEGP